MRVLVLGGSGFFGKSLLSFAANRVGSFRSGGLILASRRPEVLQRDVPHLLGSHVRLMSYDVASGAPLPGCDVVIHAAATSDASRYRDDPDGEYRTIVEGTSAVLRAMSRLPRGVGLVFASSGAVYGPQPAHQEMVAEDQPFLDVLEPGKAVYTKAKRRAEELVRAFALENDRPAVAARCFAFVGEHLPIDLHFAIGNVIADVEARRAVKVRAPHHVFRSYMSADDLCLWLLGLATERGLRGEAVNVGSDASIELHDLGRRLAREAGLPYDGRQSEELEPHVDRYVPNVSKAEGMGLHHDRDTLGVVMETIVRRAAARWGRP